MLKLESAVTSACEQKLKQQKYEGLIPVPFASFTRRRLRDHHYGNFSSACVLKEYLGLDLRRPRIIFGRGSVVISVRCLLSKPRRQSCMIRWIVRVTLKHQSQLYDFLGSLMCCFRQNWRSRPFWIWSKSLKTVICLGRALWIGLLDCRLISYGRYKKIFAGREKIDRKGTSRSVFRGEALSAVETDVFAKFIGWMYWCFPGQITIVIWFWLNRPGLYYV